MRRNAGVAHVSRSSSDERMALSLSGFAAVWLCGKLVVLRIVSGQGAPGGGPVAGDESISLGCGLVQMHDRGLEATCPLKPGGCHMQ